MKPLQMQFSVDEVNLITEALERRASRLISMARADPKNAGPNERKAERMLTLRGRLLRHEIALGYWPAQ